MRKFYNEKLKILKNNMILNAELDLKLMINDGSKLGEIVQENTYSIVENY